MCVLTCVLTHGRGISQSQENRTKVISRVCFYMRFDDVSIGDDVPELLRGLDPEGAGEAAFCGGTAGLTNRSCDILIKERDIPPDIPVWGGDEETAFKVCAQVGQRPIGLGGLKASRATPISDEGAVPAIPSRLYVSKLGLRGRVVGTGLEVVRVRLTGVEPAIVTPKELAWP